MHAELSKKYEMKKTLISDTDDHEPTNVNRKLQLTHNGARLEGDPKHVDIVLREWGLEYAKGVDTPMTKECASCVGDGDQV